MKNKKIFNPVISALFAALLAVVSQIAVPTPFGAPLTLQTFAVTLCGYILGAFWSVGSVAVWIAVGLIGLPVFSGFGGGPSVLFGATGGFIWGFLLLAFMCGASRSKGTALRLLSGTAGLIICHIIGAVQFKLVYGVSLWAALVAVSLPYILKDLLSLAAAYAAAKKIERLLWREN